MSLTHANFMVIYTSSYYLSEERSFKSEGLVIKIS